MKSEVFNPEQESTFPKLMYAINHPEKVVLFSESGYGVVISAQIGGTQKIGYYSTSWGMKDFRDFNGSVTLSNK